LHRTNPRQGVQDEKHVEAELKQRKGSWSTTAQGSSDCPYKTVEDTRGLHKGQGGTPNPMLSKPVVVWVWNVPWRLMGCRLGPWCKALGSDWIFTDLMD
jgi:hypothetical protein